MGGRTTERSTEAYIRVERQLEAPMLVLSLLFIPVVAAPLLFELTEAQNAALEAASWFIWAAFVVEYALLLYLAPSRARMVRTRLPDLFIIVLPFLRPPRALRVLRAAAGLGRASVALRRIATRPGFRGFFLVAVGAVIVGAATVRAFERDVEGANIDSFSDALWWALVTVTTVGYGDQFPVSPEARGVAVVLMLVGIGLFSVLTANVAAFFVEVGDKEAVSLTDLDQRLARIEELLASQTESSRSGGAGEDRSGNGLVTAGSDAEMLTGLEGRL